MQMGKERAGNWGSTKVGRWSVPRSEGVPGVHDAQVEQGVRTMGSVTRGGGGDLAARAQGRRREEASRKHGLLQGFGFRA